MTKTLKFWGVRGSCPVSGPQYAHFGGNTSCLEIRYNDTLIIFDAGTGIRPLGETLKSAKKIDLVLSHFHWDHVAGFPFFEPLYHSDVHLTIWAPQGKKWTIEDLFDHILAEEFFPINLHALRAKIEFRPLAENQPIQIGQMILECHRVRHPSLTYSFKIKTPHQTIGYVTDNEIGIEPDPHLIQFFRGSELFIHEAQYLPQEYTHKKGWGHTCITDAIAFINQINPKRWLVSHHDPSHTDEQLFEMERQARLHPLRCPVEWVKENQSIQID